MLGEIFRDKSLFYKSFPYVQLSHEMKKKNNEKDDWIRAHWLSYLVWGSIKDSLAM